MKITEPGIYDIDPGDYHQLTHIDGEPVLSQSAAKALLEEAGPARFRAEQDGPRIEKKAFDLGTATHALLLGKGEERLVHLDFPDYRTKAAREARDAAYADGATPLLAHEWERLQTTAEQIPDHVKDWFTSGRAEVGLFWQHESGLWLKGQLDYVTDGGIIDLKTARSTTTWDFEAHAYRYGYHVQAGHYQAGYHLLTGARLPYYIVTVDLERPTLSRVWQVPDAYLTYGATQMERAIEIYLDCTEQGEWPAYPAEPATLNPPRWAQNVLAETQAAAEIAALEQLLGEEQ